MVYLLDHVEYINEAKESINSMLIKPNTTMCTCLLSAYRIHKYKPKLQWSESNVEHDKLTFYQCPYVLC